MSDLFTSRPSGVGCCTALATSVLLFAGTTAVAGNALSNAIERAQPCRSLKVKTALFAVGVDQFENVQIEDLAVTVKGDLASAKAIGSLTCRTSDKAVVKGNVAARLSFEAQMDLTNCAVTRHEVKILSTSGTFGGVVAALGEQISQSLRDGLVTEAKKLCL